MNAGGDRERPLSGITVISIEQAIAAPFCVRGSVASSFARSAATGKGVVRIAQGIRPLIQSEAGLLSITGTPEEPSKAGISIADIAGAVGALISEGVVEASLQAGPRRSNSREKEGPAGRA